MPPRRLTLWGWPGGAGLAAACLALAAILSGCDNETPTPAPTPPTARRFDGQAAFASLRHLMSFGPRIPGSRGSRNALAWARKKLEALGFVCRTQPFRVYDGTEKRHYAMVNLMASLSPERRPRVLLGTHYDTRRWADLDPDPSRRNDPVPGANDGGSGVALLLELARLLAQTPPRVGVDIVLFDGEDFGRAGSDDYCQGSRYFVEHPPPFTAHTTAAIIVDLVADADLCISREKSSLARAPRLVERIWNAADRLGAGDVFVDEARYEIRDDHTPLQEILNIPSVLLIDFDYEGRFHTVHDTLDQCAPESLQIVGDVLLDVLTCWEVSSS